jgi:hypothetical protein
MIARLYRIFKYAFLGLFLVIIVAGALVWFQGETLVRRYTPAIEAELSQHLRAQVRISDLEIDLFPSPGALAKNVSIVPFGGCGGVTAAVAEFRIDPWALLEGRYVITSLAFSGVRTEVSVVDGVVSLHADAGVACSAQASEQSQASSQVPQKTPSPTEAGGRFSTFALELKDFAVRDAQIVVLTTERHTLRISELLGAAALSEGVLSLAESKVKADLDKISLDLSARSIHADFVQAIFDLNDGRISVNDEQVSLSGRYGPGAQLSDGKISTRSFSLPKLVEAARKMGIDLSGIRSGEVSGSSDLSYSKPVGLSVRTRDLQVKKIALLHRGSAYEASLMRGPLECRASGQTTGCTADLVFEGFRYANEKIAVSNVSARLEKLKASMPVHGGMRVSGTLIGSSLKLESPSVQIKNISSVSAPLEVSLSPRGEYSVVGVVAGRGVELRAAEREFSQVGGDVKVELSSTGDSFSTSNLSASVMGQPLKVGGGVAVSPTGYSFQNIEMDIAGGAVTLAGNIQRTTGRPFSARIGVRNAVVSTLAAVVLARHENPFDGQIRSLNLSLSGTLESLPSSLRGEGDFKLMSTRVRGFDLTRALADALSTIPIANLTLAKEKLSDEGLDKAAEATFTIADEKFHFSTLTFFRNQYTLTATGTYSFSKDLDLKGAVTFMKQTLSSLGGGFDKLGSLLGRVGKVEIPVFIRGRVPNISVVPDVVTLVKDNSGLTLAGDVLGTTLNAGRSVAGFVLSPFESKRNKESSSEENQSK